MGFTFHKEKNFEETSIGKVPKDWKVVKVEKVCKVVGGGTPSTNVKEYWNGKIPFVTPTDVTKLEDMNVNLLSKTESYITEKGLRNSSANLLPPGSVLLTSRATIGYCVINEVPVATNQGFASLICKENTHNLFILYLMRFIRRKLEQLAAGSTFKEIARTIVRNLRIPLPPLHEQKKIAEILSMVDTAIQKTNEVIAETARLKKGLMQELLTRGMGHKEFKDTKIGRIPKEWEVVKLGDKNVAVLIMGQSPPSSTYNKEGVGLPFLQGKAEFGEIYPSPILYCSEPMKIAETNDILLSVRAPVGDVNIAPLKCCIGRGLSAIRAKSDKLHYLFLFYYLKFGSRRFESLSMGSTFKAIRKGEIENYKIILPPLSEQREIAEILSTADKKLELERNEKTRLEKIKQGLMDLLLNGKIRVKVN